jgi:CNT family concentrative nucleoside transporter
VDAISRGTWTGWRGAEHHGALIVFVALVALVNLLLGGFGDVGGAPATVERGLGLLFTPLAWSLGIPGRRRTRRGCCSGSRWC